MFLIMLLYVALFDLLYVTLYQTVVNKNMKTLSRIEKLFLYYMNEMCLNSGVSTE